MKTYLLTLDDSQEDAIQALAKALKMDLQLINEEHEDKGLLIAIEEGIKYGRLSEKEGKAFLASLGK